VILNWIGSRIPSKFPIQVLVRVPWSFVSYFFPYVNFRDKVLLVNSLKDTVLEYPGSTVPIWYWHRKLFISGFGTISVLCKVFNRGVRVALMQKIISKISRCPLLPSKLRFEKTQIPLLPEVHVFKILVESWPKFVQVLAPGVHRLRRYLLFTAVDL
jgi:hypothetical protein